VSLASFCPEGFVGIGVPIGTDSFVQNFVAKTCRAIIDDVEKLDAIQVDSNILTLTFFSIIVAFCSNSMLIAKLLTCS
jgi:hypothetical protein